MAGAYPIRWRYVNLALACSRAGLRPTAQGKKGSSELGVGGVKSDHFFSLVPVWRGLGLFPETQMFKDILDDIRLVDEADDAPFEFPQGGELVEPHPSRAFGTTKGVRFNKLFG